MVLIEKPNILSHDLHLTSRYVLYTVLAHFVNACTGPYFLYTIITKVPLVIGWPITSQFPKKKLLDTVINKRWKTAELDLPIFLFS